MPQRVLPFFVYFFFFVVFWGFSSLPACDPRVQHAGDLPAGPANLQSFPAASVSGWKRELWLQSGNRKGISGISDGRCASQMGLEEMLDLKMWN